MFVAIVTHCARDWFGLCGFNIVCIAAMRLSFRPFAKRAQYLKARRCILYKVVGNMRRGCKHLAVPPPTRVAKRFQRTIGDRPHKPAQSRRRHPKITRKAKPTIYTLARKGLIPAYKRGKKLYFYEDELLQWIESGRKPLQALNLQEQAAEIVLGVKRKPKGGFNL